MNSKIGSLFVVALFSLTTAANAQGNGGAVPAARGNSTATTGVSTVPSDQKPTNSQNALPECGMAAETDAAGSTTKTPCTPKNVAPGPVR
jgi:hypothetical protein